MTVLNLEGQPISEPEVIEINVSQALECMDDICAILWEDCRNDPAKYQHMRIGDGDTAKSILYRIQRNIGFINEAISRRR